MEFKLDKCTSFHYCAGTYVLVKYGPHHFEDSRSFEQGTEKLFLSSITEKDLGRKLI